MVFWRREGVEKAPSAQALREYVPLLESAARDVRKLQTELLHLASLPVDERNFFDEYLPALAEYMAVLAQQLRKLDKQVVPLDVKNAVTALVVEAEQHCAIVEKNERSVGKWADARLQTSVRELLAYQERLQRYRQSILADVVDLRVREVENQVHLVREAFVSYKLDVALLDRITVLVHEIKHDPLIRDVVDRLESVLKRVSELVLRLSMHQGFRSLERKSEARV